MLTLSNGITVMLDHVCWVSLRHQKADNRPNLYTTEKWLLQFGYAGDSKTFVSYSDQAEAEAAHKRAIDALDRWVKQ